MFQEIPLSEILSVEISKHNICSENNQGSYLEIRTANVDYYVAEDVNNIKAWDVAIRQALMPVDTPKNTNQSNHMNKGNIAFALKFISNLHHFCIIM